MVAMPNEPNYNLLARNHILSIKKGVLPEGEDRPETFGKWDTTVEQIERLFDKCKGNPEKISDIIDDMARADPALGKLIAPKSPPRKGVEVVEGPTCPPLPKHLEYPPELAASACKWVDDCIAFLKKWSPRAYEGFYEAIAYSLLGTIAARRVSINFSGPKYTPLFTALVGPTSFFKKSFTTKFLPGILEAAGLDWFMGADITTPEKLLSDMAGKNLPENYGDLPEEDQERVKKRLAFAGQVGWYYDEFGTHLDAMIKENGTMAAFTGLLRLLYDEKPKYSYNTHRRKLEIVYRPYLSLLAALTDDDIKPHAQKGNKFWGNGLFARFAFVVVPRGAKFKLDWALDEELIYPRSLTTPLYIWHKWLGEPEIDVQPETNDKGEITKYTMTPIKDFPERKCLYGNEIKYAFYTYEKAITLMCQPDGDKPALVHKNLWGNYSRLPAMALSIAMLLASLENQGRVDQPEIELKHWARARQFVEERRKDLHELFDQVNTPDDSASAEMEEEVLRHVRRLAERGQEWVTANGLRGYMKGKSREEIEDKLKALEKVKVLEAQKTTQSSKYRLRPEEESPEDE
jgi:hypothetical protein